jgi:hypothetical protein
MNYSGRLIFQTHSCTYLWVIHKFTGIIIDFLHLVTICQSCFSMFILCHHQWLLYIANIHRVVSYFHYQFYLFSTPYFVCVCVCASVQYVYCVTAYTICRINKCKGFFSTSVTVHLWQAHISSKIIGFMLRPVLSTSAVFKFRTNLLQHCSPKLCASRKIKFFFSKSLK